MPGHFFGKLPLLFGLGDTVEYRVAAKDVSAADNIGFSAWQSFVVGYEDFESGLQSWQTDSAGWGLCLSGHLGGHSVNSSPRGYYPPNQDVCLTSKYGVDLSNPVMKIGSASKLTKPILVLVIAKKANQLG